MKTILSALTVSRELVFLFLSPALCLSSLAAPALTPAYISFLGGRGDGYQEEVARAVAVDAQGNGLVAWNTADQNLPLLRRYGPPEPGEMGILTKVSPAGDQVVFHVAFLWTVLRGVATDSQGNVYVVGDTDLSAEFLPVTNAVQPQPGGQRDAFVARVSADGTQVHYCTYLGGGGLELGTDIAVDAAGNAYVTGWTASTNFPVTAGAAQTTAGGSFDAFVAKLLPDGSQLAYATYLGGDARESGASIAVDGSGRAYVAGSTTSTAFTAGVPTAVLGSAERRNAYVARLSADGRALEALSFMGGSLDDYGAAVAIDAQGNAYVLGRTESADFPSTPGSVRPISNAGVVLGDAFLAKLNPSGTGFVYATFLGGSNNELLLHGFYAGAFDLDGELVDDYLQVERGGLAVDAAGSAYVAGSTTSSDFAPTQAVNLNGGSWEWDAFLAKVDPTGASLAYFAYLSATLGDWAWDLALHAEDDVLLVGSTSFSILPPHFPATPGAFQSVHGGSVSDAFVARYVRAAGPPANDAFAQRTLLAGTIQTVRLDNSLATREAGEPTASARASGRTLWWSWTAPAQGRCFLATDGAREPFLLAVYSGDQLAALTPLAMSENPNDGTRARRLTIPVQAGQVLQIAADGLDGAFGEVVLNLTFSAPPNDDFADRIAVTGFPLTLSGTNRYATFEANEPVHELYGRHSVWWSWTAPATRAVRVTTEGSDFDIQTTAYSNSPTLGLQRIAGAQGGNPEGFTFLAIEGLTYEIAADGYYGQTGLVVLNFQPGVPPPNDDFSQAAVLSGFTASAEGTNITATREPGEWLPGQIEAQQTDVTSGRTLWWIWEAPTNGYVRILTEGEGVETIFAAYTGTAVANLQRVATGNDQPGTSSQAYFRVQEGTAYYIQVDATRYSPPGLVRLSLQLTQPPEIIGSTFQRSPEGVVTFQVRGVAGHIYQLQTSPDLSTWSPVGEVLQGVEFPVTHQPAPGLPHFFYRLVDVSPPGN